MAGAADGLSRRWAGAHAESPCFAERIRSIDAAIAAGDCAAALRALRWAVRVPQPPADVRRYAARMARLPPDSIDWQRTCRIAILSAANIADRASLLRLYLAADLVGVELYTGPFGRIDEEILDAESGYHRFQPDLTILAPASGPNAHFEEAEPDLNVERWIRLWETIQERHRGRVIHHGLEVPCHSVLGNLDLTLPESLGRRIREFNLELAAAAPAGVSVLDVDGLAATVGKRVWSDTRFWFLAKENTSVAGRVALAHAEAALVRGFLGRSKRVVALDLDNTLWGGIISEDGLAGIRLAGDAEGEAFVGFQRYLKALRARGILLALISKNDEEEARLPFEKHPEMILAWDDFAAVRVNWQSKSDNLEAIAAELALDADTFVFVDDDPRERAEMRVRRPEVEVVCMPRDPSHFVAALAEGRWFDVPAISDQDRVRADDYRAARAVRSLRATAASLDDLLEGLRMEAEIAPFDGVNLPRIVQLLHRSNQYNLTAPGYGEAEIARMMATVGIHTRFLRLRDRFADRGIVSLLIARERDEALEVDTWLMSCRVLGRTVEHALLGHLLELADARGLRRIAGSYVPTAKNALVRDHYARLGFTCVGAGPQGDTRWERSSGGTAPLSFVEVVRATAPPNAARKEIAGEDSPAASGPRL